VTTSQRKELGDYLWGVGLGVFFSIPTAFAAPFFPHVHWFAKLFLWGVPFGSAIYIGKAVQAKLRKLSFGLMTLMSSISMIALIASAFAFSFLFLIAAELRLSPFSSRVLANVGEIMGSTQVQRGTLFSWIGVLVISSIFQVSRKLGPGVLRNWILGKYHRPREEERIFMFLDMKDSTTLAEKLGALRFSSLVKDFFSDLTSPVLESRAEVSHYIGDEAVLSWQPARGLAKANCLRLFFLFQKQLDIRADYYRRTYGLVPEFKAGAHIGLVVATEIGEVKSEIVYHGDVLNTAARIQSMCNSLDESFLISGELARQFDSMTYSLRPMGSHFLKGKEHDIEIYAVLASGPSLGAQLPIPDQENAVV